MDILKRGLAPISKQGWDEIDDLARDTLRASLSARKFVDVSGPHGIDHTSVNLGRLAVPKDQKGSDVCYGVYDVLPLIETRVRFSLNMWELDNIERGAQDADLDVLVDAAKQIAAFEERAVYEGFSEAGINGLHTLAKEQSVPVRLNQDELLEGITEGMNKLLEAGIDAPATLVAGDKLWKTLSHAAPGGSLRKLVERITSGKVIYAPSIPGGFLAAERGDDFVLHLGQDFSIGYHSHTTQEVQLFIMESFTFQVVSPEAVVGLDIS